MAPSTVSCTSLWHSKPTEQSNGIGSSVEVSPSWSSLPVMGFLTSCQVYLAISLSVPPLMVLLFFPGFYGVFMLYIHIWRLGARKQSGENMWTCYICLSGSRLFHSIESFLDPSTCLLCSYFIFLHSWIVFHSVCAPHFHYTFMCWRTFKCFYFIIFISWLLWIGKPWTQLSKYLWNRMSSL